MRPQRRLASVAGLFEPLENAEAAFLRAATCLLPVIVGRTPCGLVIEGYDWTRKAGHRERGPDCLKRSPLLSHTGKLPLFDQAQNFRDIYRVPVLAAR